MTVSERRRGSDWDVVVIGSGIGGLTAAAYLAANGRRTVVLEQHEMAGGCSQVFRRKRMFEFDVGLHYVGDCEAGGIIPTCLAGLGIADRVDWLEMDRDGFDTIVYPDLEFRVPRGWDHYRERLIEHFPYESTGIDRCVSVLRRVGYEARRIAPTSLRAMLRLPLEGRGVMRWATRSLADLFRACRLGPGPRGVLAGQSGLYGSPPSRASLLMHAIMLDHYIGGGAFYPRGGGQVPAALLVDVIRANGGEVRTRARVSEIVVRRGKVEGVRLDDGEAIAAPVVVSDADLKRTLLELVDAEHLSGRTRRRVRRFELAPPIFTSYLGVDVDLGERIPNCNHWLWPDRDVEPGFRALRAGRMPSQPFVYVSSGSRKDPDSTTNAPSGWGNLELMSFVPFGRRFWQLAGEHGVGERYSRDPAYRAVKQRIADQLIEVTAAAVPGLADLDEHVVWQESSTPITQERYTMSWDGAPYGLEFTPRQVGMWRPRPQTEIEGLHLVGASTIFCHGIAGTMLGGVASAGSVLGRDLLAEVERGAVFGDRRRLRSGGPGWDPYFACRRLSWKPRAAGRLANGARPPSPSPSRVG